MCNMSKIILFIYMNYLISSFFLDMETLFDIAVRSNYKVLKYLLKIEMHNNKQLLFFLQCA